MRNTRGHTWREKTLKNEATIKTGTEPTEKLTNGLRTVCLSRKGGTEYRTPARLPTTIKTVNNGICVATPKLTATAKKKKETNNPNVPSFFVYSALKGSDFSSKSAS
jgi:hypothetical protein